MKLIDFFLIATGLLLITAVISAGFIRVSDAEWQHYRLVFPTLAGLGLALGGICVAVGVFSTIFK